MFIKCLLVVNNCTILVLKIEQREIGMTTGDRSILDHSLEISLILIGGAVGGMLSVASAWNEPSTFPLTAIKLLNLVAVPFVSGAMAAGVGVYVLTTFDPNQKKKAFFFAFTCGLAFPSILSESGGLVNDTKNRVALADFKLQKKELESLVNDVENGEMIEESQIAHTIQNFDESYNRYIERVPNSNLSNPKKEYIEKIHRLADEGNQAALALSGYLKPINTEEYAAISLWPHESSWEIAAQRIQSGWLLSSTIGEFAPNGSNGQYYQSGLLLNSTIGEFAPNWSNDQYYHSGFSGQTQYAEFSRSFNDQPLLTPFSPNYGISYSTTF
tara:strand:+ start:5651 stop:6634 length:984 start_codon:yes stop_codon:yes gene_type:complete